MSLVAVNGIQHGESSNHPLPSPLLIGAPFGHDASQATYTQATLLPSPTPHDDADLVPAILDHYGESINQATGHAFHRRPEHASHTLAYLLRAFIAIAILVFYTTSYSPVLVCATSVPWPLIGTFATQFGRLPSAGFPYLYHEWPYSAVPSGGKFALHPSCPYWTGSFGGKFDSNPSCPRLPNAFHVPWTYLEDSHVPWIFGGNCASHPDRCLPGDIHVQCPRSHSGSLLFHECEVQPGGNLTTLHHSRRLDQAHPHRGVFSGGTYASHPYRCPDLPWSFSETSFDGKYALHPGRLDTPHLYHEWPYNGTVGGSSTMPWLLGGKFASHPGRSYSDVFLSRHQTWRRRAVPHQPDMRKGVLGLCTLAPVAANRIISRNACAQRIKSILSTSTCVRCTILIIRAFR